MSLDPFSSRMQKNEKNTKKIKFVKKFRTTFFFSDFFVFFSKKVNFSKNIRYFFLVLSRPPRRVLKPFSEKNSKKIKNFKFFKFFRTTFFFEDFFDFLTKKTYFSKSIRYFFLVVSRTLRRVLKTFSEKNSKKSNFIFFKKFRKTFFFQRSKPLKVPSLARSVRKPLKSPSLARSV